MCVCLFDWHAWPPLTDAQTEDKSYTLPFLLLRFLLLLQLCSLLAPKTQRWWHPCKSSLQKSPFTNQWATGCQLKQKLGQLWLTCNLQKDCGRTCIWNKCVSQSEDELTGRTVVVPEEQPLVLLWKQTGADEWSWNFKKKKDSYKLKKDRVTPSEKTTQWEE